MSHYFNKKRYIFLTCYPISSLTHWEHENKQSNQISWDEMTNIWFLLTPSFLRSYIMKTPCRTPVQNIKYHKQLLLLKKILGNFLLCNILLIMSITILFFLPAIPFCWRVYLAFNWCWIPYFFKKSSQTLYSTIFLWSSHLIYCNLYDAKFCRVNNWVALAAPTILVKSSLELLEDWSMTTLCVGRLRQWIIEQDLKDRFYDHPHVGIEIIESVWVPFWEWNGRNRCVTAWPNDTKSNPN